MCCLGHAGGRAAPLFLGMGLVDRGIKKWEENVGTAIERPSVWLYWYQNMGF